jgi:dephospho-CoA kinase
VIVVGLTGGIGSGKSTVSVELAARGAVVIDADAITKELQEPGQPVFDAIVERFGSAVVGSDGRLDRQGLADIVFNDAESLQALNGLVHPAVGAEITRRIEAVRLADGVVVLDVPLLIESGRYHVAGIVVVDTPTDVALERLVTFRGLRADDAQARMARQASREERLAKADYVIDNSGSREGLLGQIDPLWEWIRTRPSAPEPSTETGDQPT